MTTSWTKINKPAGTSYVFVAKPVGTTSVVTNTFTGGNPIGLLLSLTQSSLIGSNIVTTSKWTDVTEHTASWVNVPKAI